VLWLESHYFFEASKPGIEGGGVVKEWGAGNPIFCLSPKNRARDIREGKKICNIICKNELVLLMYYLSLSKNQIDMLGKELVW
jgi:hypothetical protein